MRGFIVLLSLLFATVAPAAAQSAGAWSGVGFQVDALGKQSEWTMQVRIGADGKGEVSYPSLGCAGVLTPVEGNVWRETITSGDCIDGGRIALIPARGRVFWFWTGENTDAPDVSASAVLYPAAGIS